MTDIVYILEEESFILLSKEPVTTTDLQMSKFILLGEYKYEIKSVITLKTDVNEIIKVKIKNV